MRLFILLTTLTFCIFFTSCQKQEEKPEVVEQKYTHKYGMEVPKEEWQSRGSDGTVLSVLDNGVTMSQNYVNGLLHGETKITYPESKVVEQLLVYDQGTLIKKVFYDEDGLPTQEELYDFENKKTVTTWNHSGVPLSVEEYHDDLLFHGEYFNEKHECEATVAQGTGQRVHRSSDNVLLSKDTFQDGKLMHRTTYFPGGVVQSENPYQDYVLHGKQVVLSEEGKPVMEATWVKGQLDGTKILYSQGVKTAEIPYILGKKQGMERHYDENQNLVAEINWDNDLRHGSSRQFNKDDIKIEWFYRGKSVSLEKFQMMEFREKLIADLNVTSPKESEKN